MIKTTFRKRYAVAQIVEQYRILAGTSEKPASLRRFAETLTEALVPLGRRISYQSVKNWQDRLYLPDAFGMLRLSQAARYDWRGDFAIDILATLDPSNYLPASEIGRRALAAYLVHLEGGNNGNNGSSNRNGNGHKGESQDEG